MAVEEGIQTLEDACRRVQALYQLTQTENKIVQLIAEGYTLSEIADIRCRSIETIRTQVKSVKDKMQVPRTNLIPNIIQSYICETVD